LKVRVVGTSCLGQPRGESLFKIARHIHTNQLGILWAPTKVGALGWISQQVTLGTHIITPLGTSTFLMWQWGVVCHFFHNNDT
jgi:hypothetical protein